MTIDEPNFGTRISAVFIPTRKDDLRPGVGRCIGKRLTFRFAGYVDFESPYEGQAQWMPEGEEMPGVAWVPQSDLSEILQR